MGMDGRFVDDDASEWMEDEGSEVEESASSLVGCSHFWASVERGMDSEWGIMRCL